MNPQREPIFSANQPWPPIALTVLIIGGYALQAVTPNQAAVFAWAFAPADLDQGRWLTLASSLFIHGSWGHAGMNAAFALAFGAPVARYLGVQAGGVASFFLFYLACGVVASLGYALFHLHQTTLLAGASGAVSGLAAAASRLIAGRGTLGRVLSPTVVGMGAAWLIVNLIIAVAGFAPGAGDAQVAWEAHIAGFLAGLIFSPALRPASAPAG